MAYPVYTTRIYAGTVPGTNTHTKLQGIPPGYRAVIKFIWVYQLPASEASFRIYLGPGLPEVFRVYPGGDTDNSYHAVELVFHENESIYGYARTTQAVVSLHGYLFTGTGAPFVPGTLPA